MEGIAALSGSENRSRYKGVSQLQSHHSHYSVCVPLIVTPLFVPHMLVKTGT